MDVIIASDGIAQCIYDETIDLQSLGRVEIRRASHVDPTEDGQWSADLSPVGGPTLGPFENRSQAIDAEIAWLRIHLLDAFEHGMRSL